MLKGIFKGGFFRGFYERVLCHGFCDRVLFKTFDGEASMWEFYTNEIP